MRWSNAKAVSDVQWYDYAFQREGRTKFGSMIMQIQYVAPESRSTCDDVAW